MPSNPNLRRTKGAEPRKRGEANGGKAEGAIRKQEAKGKAQTREGGKAKDDSHCEARSGAVNGRAGEPSTKAEESGGGT